MSSVWDDPFGQGEIETKNSRIFLHELRQRHKRLLPYIDQWVQAAQEAFSTIAADRRPAPVPAIAHKTLVVHITYRLPDAPSLINDLPAIHINTVALPFSSQYKTPIPVFDHLMPTRRYINFEDPKIAKRYTKSQRDAIIAAEEGLGLHRIPPEQGKMIAGDHIVVCPDLLKYVRYWIENIDGPMNDLRYAELGREYDIRSSEPTPPGVPVAKKPARSVALH